MTVSSRRSLFFLPFLYTYLLYVFICPSEDGLFLFPKTFLRNLKFGVSFLARFSAVGKCRVQILRRTLTIEYTFIRYVAWAMGETLSRTRYAKIHLPLAVSAEHKVWSDSETDSEISGCYGYGDDRPRL